jgi:hypothetical protein
MEASVRRVEGLVESLIERLERDGWVRQQQQGGGGGGGIV